MCSCEIETVCLEATIPWYAGPQLVNEYRDKSWLIIVFLKFPLVVWGGLWHGCNYTWYFTAELATQELLLPRLFWEDWLLLERQLRGSGKIGMVMEVREESCFPSCMLADWRKAEVWISCFVPSREVREFQTVQVEGRNTFWLFFTPPVTSIIWFSGKLSLPPHVRL